MAQCSTSLRSYAHDASLDFDGYVQSRMHESAHGMGPGMTMNQKLVVLSRENMVRGRRAALRR
jgi:hypothetical protein